MTENSADRDYAAALDEAERLLGFRLEPFLETKPSEPANADDFMPIATTQAFGDAWTQALLTDA
jgi:4-carboxymuconolactone decarboxylase